MVAQQADDGAPGPGPTNPGDSPDIANIDDVFIGGNAAGCNSIEEILQGPPDPLIFDNGFEAGN